MCGKDDLSKNIALEYHVMRKDGISFSWKYYIFLRIENERWYFSKNTWKYDDFLCKLVKVVFLFPADMKLPFCQKSKDNLLPKNTPKGDIYSITKKYDIHSKKYDVGILCTFMETFLSIFIKNAHAFP